MKETLLSQLNLCRADIVNIMLKLGFASQSPPLVIFEGEGNIDIAKIVELEMLLSKHISIIQSLNTLHEIELKENTGFVTAF
jgi:hypothetical protein